MKRDGEEKESADTADGSTTDAATGGCRTASTALGLAALRSTLDDCWPTGFIRGAD